MSATRPLTRIRTKLLLSYLLVIAASIVGLIIGIQLLGPSIFDRMLAHHAEGHPGMMGVNMTEPMRQMSANAYQDAMFDAVLLSTIVATLIAVLISVLVANRITAPLRRLATGSQRIAAGDYRARVQVLENDEIGELASSFNRMASALEHTEQRRVRLIGDVAHELRTPLATLRGNLEGLQDSVVEPSDEVWDQLLSETARLSRLVDDLQELSRVESGQIPLYVQPVDLEGVIETAIARLETQFDEKGVALHREVSEALPGVAADPDRTVRIMTNLLTNARRYTPSGGSVTVSARPDEDTVRVQVADTGSGIPAEHLPHIFDRFYRVDRARSRALGGSGIGLSITKALVEAQGGRIWAESSGPDQGSTFWFTLPIAKTG
jgi:two-component system, OmpR family, sensor histidine kinase BaeS